MEHFIVLHALAVRLKLCFVNISLNRRSSDNKQRCNVGIVNKVLIVLGVLCTRPQINIQTASVHARSRSSCNTFLEKYIHSFLYETL